jgi:hypothetical protein
MVRYLPSVLLSGMSDSTMKGSSTILFLPRSLFTSPAPAQSPASTGTRIPVESFSTLGFTRDPLYSFMKGYSAFQLASLILHEQTHATLFVKGQTQFSEAMIFPEDS